ncbi:hypothetical protein WA026_018156 [Henosepilachna vigintioctopunctata]|uniref:LAGLIDADG homing endonuclease n=1 Tax=Henosepilachna vigintioctopunctata TaxID=420089 RepID=A0AAW1UME2_9CUCU
MYADDSNFSFSCGDIGNLCQVCTLALNTSDEWCHSNGLVLNESGDKVNVNHQLALFIVDVVPTYKSYCTVADLGQIYRKKIGRRPNTEFFAVGSSDWILFLGYPRIGY